MATLADLLDYRERLEAARYSDARRVRDARRNHDRVAARLNASPWLEVPQKLAPE